MSRSPRDAGVQSVFPMEDPSLPAALGDIAPWITKALSRGAADSRSAFHWPTLGTVTPEGAPAMRTVVLRDHAEEERALTFYTDKRSGKVADLSSNPRAVVHAYEPKKKVQLRLTGRVTLHSEDEHWTKAWHRIRDGRTADFAHAPAPGTSIADHDGFDPHGAEAKEHLLVLRFTYQRADYLHLGRDAHRRASVNFGVEPPEATWLVP